MHYCFTRKNFKKAIPRGNLTLYAFKFKKNLSLTL